MMNAIFYGLLLFSDWTVLETELYQPLSPRHVLVDDSGEVYFIHHDDKAIAHFSADGRRLPSIGGTGVGPGQFIQAFDIFLDKNTLYVPDFWTQRIVCFDKSGTFIKNLKQPFSNLRVLKVANGWLYIKFGSTANEPSRLVISDDDFSNPKTLIQWTKRQKISPDVFFPVLDIAQLVATPDGRQVFFYKPGSFEIYRIDVSARTISRHISKSWEAFPFDKSWGREEWKREKTQLDRRPVFPETFPAISGMAMSPWKTLWVTRGNRPDLLKLLTFDARGELMKLNDPAALLSRVLAFHSDWALVQGETSEEEIVLHKVPLSELRTFVAVQKVD